MNLNLFFLPFLLFLSTIGIEIVDDVPNVDAVIVPVGGAGLIAGVSCSVKTLKPECKVCRAVFCLPSLGDTSFFLLCLRK